MTDINESVREQTAVVETKICSKCKREKPRNCFSKDTRAADGLQCHCKECQSYEHKKLRERDIERDIPETKKCRDCNKVLPASDFYKNKVNSDGLAPKCKTCHNASSLEYSRKKPDKARERREKWKNDNPERHFSAQRKYLLKQYNLTVEEYVDMLEERHQVCQVCGRQERTVRSLPVDHCHQTGVVRGLLCSDCNKMLGMANDDPAILRKLVEYLENSAPMIAQFYANPEND